jgi:hypothetical protein
MGSDGTRADAFASSDQTIAALLAVVTLVNLLPVLLPLGKLKG